MKTRFAIIFVFITLYSLLFSQTPNWEWVSSFGGVGHDCCDALDIDNDNNIYFAGSFQETVTFGSYTFTSYGGSDSFVAKMDSNGNFLWVKQAGGDNNCNIRSLIVDSYNNIYVSGGFQGTIVFDSFSITSVGSYDMFVAKVDSEGNWLWVSQGSGSSSCSVKSLVKDSSDDIYVTGDFQGDFIFNSTTITSMGDYDIFVAKIDSEGNWLWAIQAGGSHTDYSNGIAYDGFGNIYLTGYFFDSALFGTFSVSSLYLWDIFLAKIDSDGNWLWVSQAGGYGDVDESYDIDIDDYGNCILTGCFSLSATFGSFTINGSMREIFVAKADSEGNWLWAIQAGGFLDDSGYSLSIDSSGSSYVTGYFGNTASFGDYSLTTFGNGDIFVAKVDSEGNWLWVIQAGGNSNDYSYKIKYDDYGCCYIVGQLWGVATFGDYSTSHNGNTDGFIAKISNVTSAENTLSPSMIKPYNHPNPFNPSTTIEFSIQNDSEIELSIFNIKGQKIKTLLNNELTKGSHSIIWNGEDNNNNLVSSGIYYYKLNVNGRTEAVKKCLLLK